MRKLLLFLAFLFGSQAFAQTGNIPNTVIQVFSGAPAGVCMNNYVAVRTDTGAFYDCLSNAWNAVTGGGGSGTVTSIATTSPITGGTITTTGTIGCATCTTSAAALTSNNLIIGSGGQAEAALGSLGSATTVLHGGAGAPTFGAVALATDVSGQLPIGAVGSAGLSGTAPITISAAGAIGCATCATGTTVSSFSGDGTVITNSSSTGAVTATIAGTSGGVPYFSSSSGWASSAALTANSPILGGGAGTAPKVSTGITSNGASEIDLGLNGTASGVLGLNGSTSGKASFTSPAVAGTRTNPIAVTNTLAGPDGSASNPTYGFTNNTGVGMFQAGGIVDVTANTIVILGPNNNNSGDQWEADSAAFFPNLDNSVSIGKSAQRATNLFAVTVTPNTYSSATNCSSSASPAVCAAAPAGSVVIAATASTVTVNTTAVTANSQIFLAADDTLGTKLSVTCNSTLATLIGGLAITARTAGTSFQITSGATPAVNPLCLSYFIIN